MIQEKSKEEMLKVFRLGIEREENESALLPQSKQHIVAAIAFGYPNEFPKERPRKNINDIVEWRN